MKTREEQVVELSTRLLEAMPADTMSDIAVIALLDAGVRILKASAGFDNAAACIEIARVANEIGAAERAA